MLEAETYRIRAGVLELIAGIALAEVHGVSGTGIRTDHPEDLRKRKSLIKGVRAEAEDGKAAIDVDVNMEYGKDFIALAREAQERVTGAVEAMTGWEVVAVNVSVVGVNAP
ncbi:MAG: Asp23/Gls24 family envelope stress response protein [Actinomycetota bacterium]